MLSKSLKNIHSLKKDDYFEKNNILEKIYKKYSYLIKVNSLDDKFYEDIFDKDFNIYDKNSKKNLDKLVYLYKKYSFFVFNDIKIILFVLSACGSLEDFSVFYQIFKKNRSLYNNEILRYVYLFSILYDNLNVFNFLNNKEKELIKYFDEVVKIPVFILAAKYKSIKIVNDFIVKGVDINTTDKRKNTALIWASYYGHIEIVKLLINKIIENRKNIKGEYNIKKYNNKYIDAKNNNGMTALVWASSVNHADVVKLLIENGSSLDKSGAMAILESVYWGNISVVKILIDKIIENRKYIKDKKEIEEYNNKYLNVKDKEYKKTPLIWAAYRGYAEIVKLLLDAGADFNERDDDGQTALIGAAISGHAEIVKLLIEKGADVNIEDKYNKTALDYAEKDEIKQLLLEAMEKQKKQQYNS